MTQIPQGNNMFWDVQSAVTVASTAAGTNVSSYNSVTMHLDGEIYVNFGASSTAAISTANDIKLAYATWKSNLQSMRPWYHQSHVYHLNHLQMQLKVCLYQNQTLSQVACMHGFQRF